MSLYEGSNHEPTTTVNIEHETTQKGLDKTTIRTQTGDVAVIVVADPGASSSAVQECTSQAGIQHLLRRQSGGESV